MKFTRRWLGDHLETEASTDEIAERLTMPYCRVPDPCTMFGAHFRSREHSGFVAFAAHVAVEALATRESVRNQIKLSDYELELRYCRTSHGVGSHAHEVSGAVKWA